MTEATIFRGLAAALDTAADELRRMAASVENIRTDIEQDSAVARAVSIHPQLGPRQRQLIEQLDDEAPSGLSTRQLADAITYDEPNVHLTLQGLVSRGFVIKDASVSPHRYMLSPRLRPSDAD